MPVHLNELLQVKNCASQYLPKPFPLLSIFKDVRILPYRKLRKWIKLVRSESCGITDHFPESDKNM
jgi:hypothetical protein